jgi:hypothetical protein
MCPPGLFGRPPRRRASAYLPRTADWSRSAAYSRFISLRVESRACASGSTAPMNCAKEMSPTPGPDCWGSFQLGRNTLWSGAPLSYRIMVDAGLMPAGPLRQLGEGRSWRRCAVPRCTSVQCVFRRSRVRRCRSAGVAMKRVTSRPLRCNTRPRHSVTRHPCGP